MNRRSLCLAACFGLPAWGQQGTTPNTLVLTTDAEESTYYGIWLRRVYGEALRRLGMQLETVRAPTKRGDMLAAQGQSDGEMGRAPSYAAAHPELVMVDAPLYTISFTIYSRGAVPEVTSLNDLRDTKDVVVFRRGVMVCDRALKAVVPPERLTEVGTPAQALGMLARGHARFYCEVNASVTNELMSTADKSLSAFRLFDIGEPIRLKGFLVARHAALAPKLAAALRQMEAEGLYERYHAEALARLSQDR